MSVIIHVHLNIETINIQKMLKWTKNDSDILTDHYAQWQKNSSSNHRQKVFCFVFFFGAIMPWRLTFGKEGTRKIIQYGLSYNVALWVFRKIKREKCISYPVFPFYHFLLRTPRILRDYSDFTFHHILICNPT